MDSHCFLIGLLCNMNDCLHYSKIMLCNSGYLYEWNCEKNTCTKSLGHFAGLTEFCKCQLYVNLLEQNWPTGAQSETHGHLLSISPAASQCHPNSATSAVVGRCLCPPNTTFRMAVSKIDFYRLFFFFLLYFLQSVFWFISM